MKYFAVMSYNQEVVASVTTIKDHMLKCVFFFYPPLFLSCIRSISNTAGFNLFKTQHFFSPSKNNWTLKLRSHHPRQRTFKRPLPLMTLCKHASTHLGLPCLKRLHGFSSFSDRFQAPPTKRAAIEGILKVKPRWALTNYRLIFGSDLWMTWAL